MMNINKSYGGSLQQLISSTKILKNTSFLLSGITYQSDIFLSKEEFLYLVNLEPNTFITVKQINKAYDLLMLKNRFQSIDIDVSDTSTGKHLHFKLTGNWILKKVTIQGIVFGKQSYANLYSLQPGEAFDIEQHEESIQAIKQYLYDQGYLEAQVIDELSYTKKNKMINAIITIKRGSLFRIHHVDFDFSDQSKHSVLDLSALKKSLYNQFQKGLLKSSYSKKQIEKQAKKIQHYLKKEGFLNNHILMTRTNKPDAKSTAIVFNVNLGKQKILNFSGNYLFTEQQIKEELIGLDQPDWFFSPDVIIEQLLHEYYKRGYWQTTISCKKIQNKGFLFTIDEKKPVFVQKVIVQNITTKEIENTSHFFKTLLEKKILDQTLLDRSIEDLKNFYLANGFWNFSIVEKKITKNSNNDVYTILLLVKKDQRFFWGGFAIKDHHSLESHEFFKKFPSQSPEHPIPFDIKWLKQQKIYLLNHFQKQGYWYVSVTPNIHTYPIEKTQLEELSYKNATNIFVTWNITLGPQVTFGKLIIQGNTKLPFNRILKTVKFKKNDLWNNEKLELTRKKLKRLDVFKQIQVQPYQFSKNKREKPILLTLIDDDQTELRLRAGYFLTSKNFLFKRQSTPKVGASLLVKNPTNKADQLEFETVLTRFERNCNVVYQQPSIFDLPVTGKIKGYLNKYVHPVQIGESGSAYEAEQNGFLLGFSDEYKDNSYWGITLGNEWMKTSRVRGNLKLSPSLIDTMLPYFFIEPSLIIDKRDKSIDATKGSFSFLSLKFMFPEKQGGFTSRITAEQSVFCPVYKDFIVAARIRLGYIIRRSFDQIMPIERFYLGGPFSVRGYEKDSLPPLGITEKKEQNIVEKSYTIQGGSSMLNGNLELRIPLFEKLGLVVFQDIGVLSQSGLKGFTKQWYPSTGFGLRYKTPIGAVRFDIGWKWKHRLEGDSSYAWCLTIGEAF
ncbi:MAG: BamA/TamA family outer membrane protein [bacterium]